jgi:hypothetical protein
MKKLVLAGITVAILGGCTFSTRSGQISPPSTVPVTRPAPGEASYCFIPEGCDINGHHYEAGQQVLPGDM